MNFITTIEGKNVDIYEAPEVKGVNPDTYEIRPGAFKVYWELEPEFRDGGVKGLNWHVTAVEGEYTIAYINEAGDEYDERQCAFNFDAYRDKVECSFKVSEHGSLAPETIGIFADRVEVE